MLLVFKFMILAIGEAINKSQIKQVQALWTCTTHTYLEQYLLFAKKEIQFLNNTYR